VTRVVTCLRLESLGAIGVGLHDHNQDEQPELSGTTRVVRLDQSRHVLAELFGSTRVGLYDRSH
jgi:hypothetical protein